MKTNNDHTLVDSKQLKTEFKIVQGYMEDVYADSQTKLDLLIELCQKLASKVGTFNQLFEC